MTTQSRWDDMVNMAVAPPPLPKAVQDAIAASALKQLDQLPATSQGVLPPFRVDDPEEAFEDLNLAEYLMLAMPMTVIRTTQSVLQKEDVVATILANSETPIPIGVLVDDQAGVLLYRGTEIATARKLLGDAELTVMLVKPA